MHISAVSSQRSPARASADWQPDDNDFPEAQRPAPTACYQSA